MSERSRWEEIKNIATHRREVQRIAQEHGLSFPFHDLVKMCNVALFGDDIATKLHRKFSPHHLQNGDIENKEEAAIDWESARFTKPDKPLNAYETWKKYYPEVNMEPTLKELGFWPNEEEQTLLKNFSRIVKAITKNN